VSDRTAASNPLRITPVLASLLLSGLFSLLSPWVPGSLARAAGFPRQELENVDGDRLTLKAEPGVKYTVLDFWALWCAPCISSMPELRDLADRLKDKPVRFVFVNCDNTRSNSKVRSFVRSKGINSTVLLDPDQNLMRYYGISSLPHMIVLDSLGNVIQRKSGFMLGDELILEEELQKKLSE
jgi:thiol-disulfide isomerase/thioredoxin